MTQPAATPMMAQYLRIKESHPDSILFYRMGDFYEMFFDDAVEAAEILEITLTSRDKKSDSPIPMCGVPVKAADAYIAKLIGRGKKVSVCEQVEDPASAKGLVKREVVRIITPGMILDNTLLDARSNNFILSYNKKNGMAGLASLDISTGSFRLCESRDARAILDEALKLSPSEVLLGDSCKHDPAYRRIMDAFSGVAVTFVDDREFEYKRSRDRIIEQFNTRSLEGFGCEDLKAGVGAAGALIHYVLETQLRKIEHIESIETYRLGCHLILDDTSLRNLELTQNIRNGTRTGTLIGVLDKTATSMGGRLLKSWLTYPLIDRDAINERLSAVEEARDNLPVRQAIRNLMKEVYDLERLSSKISMGQSNARDLTALKQSLAVVPEVFRQLHAFVSPLYHSPVDLGPLEALTDLIEQAIREDAPPLLTEGGLIKTGYDEDLDELIRLSRDGRSFIAELEVREKKETGLSSLKVRYNKVFGYYIEISKGQAKDAPAHYIRKQTLVNAERYITEDLKNFETRVLEAQEKRSAREYDIYSSVKDRVVENIPGIQAVARHLGRVDVLLAFADIADHNAYTRPVITEDGVIHIEDGRHPVVEQMIKGERYVPNTIHLDNEENQVLLITGPNMAGKSTVLRQVALITLMAQTGCFVPAASATISVTDRIFTRVGALDNLSQGQSTFMVEMEETANILNNATPRSLIIMDEIGRGTSTFDGLSIAWAVAEYLHDLQGKGVKTLFATHYHELTELARSKPRVKNFNIAVKEWNDAIIFLRKLVEGATNRSYGIQVARLAGVPSSIIGRAKKVLTTLEEDSEGLNRCLGQNIDSPGRDKGGSTPKDQDKRKKPVQLSLFKKPQHPVIQRLQNLDISVMTPLEALNLLHELTEQATDVLDDAGY
jgi:DNA mismatch repair protein MutS